MDHNGQCDCGRHQEAEVQPSDELVAQALQFEDALDDANSQRQRKGLPAFIRDDAMTEAAKACATYRAQRRIEGHVRGGMGDFQFVPKGSWADAAGCSVRDPGDPFATCCLFERWKYAGAAKVIGPDGREYHHLFVHK
jgi:hypothetical protein